MVVEVDLPFAAMMFKDKAEKAIAKNIGRCRAATTPTRRVSERNGRPGTSVADASG